MANEKRLIDANAFLGKLQKLSELMREGEIGEIDINLLIASTPLVDAVEVVRCKDCKWWADDYCTNINGAKGLVMNGMWFCASGERREGE